MLHSVAVLIQFVQRLQQINRPTALKTEQLIRQIFRGTVVHLSVDIVTIGDTV